MKSVVLPTWLECKKKKDDGELLNPLERFIYDNEPAPSFKVAEDVMWRESLLAALTFLEAKS